MSKQRIVKDEIWDDEWYYDLDPIEKLVWLFLLTNNRCNIAGAYKLNLKWAARTTGLDVDLFPKILNRFQNDKKVFLHEDWIFLVNFTKHQSENPSVKQGIFRVLNEIPLEVLDSLAQAVPDCPTLLYLTLPNLTLPNGEKTPPTKKPKKEKLVEENIVFGEFKNVVLSSEEYKKLVESLNEQIVTTLIAELSGYIASTGKKYKSHYATIQNWARRRINDHVKEIKNKPNIVAF